MIQLALRRNKEIFNQWGSTVFEHALLKSRVVGVGFAASPALAIPIITQFNFVPTTALLPPLVARHG